MFRSTTLLLAASLSALACGDDPTGPAATVDGGTIAGELLLGTRVWSTEGDQITSYIHNVAELTPATSLDLDRALELPGAVSLYGVDGVGWFAIGGGEDPSITRFELGDDGRFIEGNRITFQPQAVTSLWNTMIWLSPTKAYYPDRDGTQIVVWNPTAMEVTGTIDLSVTQRPGYLAYYGLTPIIRDGQVLLSVGWFDWSVNDSILGETGLVVIDSDGDELTRFDVDPRCGGISEVVTVPSGDSYLVSSALAGAAHQLGRLPTAPCALRIPAGADAIDPGPAIDLAALTGSSIVGEPVPGDGASIFLRAYDPELAEIPEGAFTYDVTAQLAWRWMRWDVEAGTAVAVDAMPPSAADGYWFAIDDRILVTRATADYSETTLVDLTAPGGPTTAMTVPGFVFAITRAR